MSDDKNRKREILKNLYAENIRGTKPKAIVTEKTVLLCHVTIAVMKGIGLKTDSGFSKAYVSSKCLKHLYDKKPAEEFDFLINSLHKIVKYPDTIYKNKDPKRGDFCFRKTIAENDYLCSLEQSENELFVATAFRLRKDSYLKSYELLWNWRDGDPSS